MTLWVGVDVGGTFTDVFGVDDVDGRTYVHKVQSTPADPSEAILAGVDGLLSANGFAAADLGQLAQGTTVATKFADPAQGWTRGPGNDARLSRSPGDRPPDAPFQL